MQDKEECVRSGQELKGIPLVADEKGTRLLLRAFETSSNRAILAGYGHER